MATEYDEIYQHTDNIIPIDTTLNGLPIEAGDFSDAKYTIFDQDFNVVLELTLNNGISFANNLFYVQTPDEQITFSGMYLHQLVLTDSEGNILPPAFQNKLKVKRVPKQ
jgi:hypothetical protein